MIANLRNYEPETIEFVVPDSIREKFPPVLFQGSTNVLGQTFSLGTGRSKQKSDA